MYGIAEVEITLARQTSQDSIQKGQYALLSALTEIDHKLPLIFVSEPCEHVRKLPPVGRINAQREVETMGLQAKLEHLNYA